MERMDDLTGVLDFLDPAALDYTQWVQVGMGLKESGYPLHLWEEWSRRDSGRYHPGECAKKWETFTGSAGQPVTAGSIVQMALDRGYTPYQDCELDWDDEIGGREKVLVDTNRLEGHELKIPEHWDPAGQLIRYLETLFEPDERVGYVTETWEKDGKFFPTKGCSDRTAGQLIDALSACHGDLGAVLGDYNPKAGAWIRFNPLDGQGVKNENVTDYRYALVESDNMELEKQNALIRELELPVACLVYSGGKSLHAIVKIQADTYEKYRRRVDYLYGVCQKNGLRLDQQNRNPSRLSRMPGVIRGEQKQYLLATNIGKGSWEEWKDWIEAETDDLPDTECLADDWDDLPPLADALISGVFARDPDAMLDMTELTITDAIREQLHNKAACRVIKAMLDKRGHADAYGPDDALSKSRMLTIAKEKLGLADLRAIDAEVAAAQKKADSMTAWRIEGTLREFASFAPVNLWFDYPVHKLDSGLLEDLQPDSDFRTLGAKGASRRWGDKAKQSKDRKAELDTAFEACMMDGEVTVYSLGEYMDLKPRTVKSRLKEDGRFWIDGEKVGRKEPGSKG